MTELIPYLIVCPLVFLAGFVDAIGGGGGLISLPAYMLAGVPPHLAIGCNKLSSCIGTSVSTGRFIINGYVRMKPALIAACFAVIGSAMGASISLMINENLLKYVMVAILPIAAYFVLRQKDLGENAKTNSKSPGQVLFISIIAAFVIGMYDGFYGPGTGTFLLLILIGVAKLDLKTASGNMKIINLASNIAALTVFIINGTILYPLALTASVFSIAGHYAGSGMVLKNGRKIVRPVILIVIFLLAIKVFFID